MGSPKHMRYLSLKDTLERAVQTVVEGNRMKLPVATKVTFWRCLEVNVHVRDAFGMVQGGLLFSNLSGRGWTFYRCLGFGCLAHQSLVSPMLWQGNGEQRVVTPEIG